MVPAILLVLYTSGGIIEYKWPGSVSWIPLEVNYWVSWTWSWIWIILLALGAIALLALIVWLIRLAWPKVVPIYHRHGPAIRAGASHVVHHPTGKKVLIGCGCLGLIVFLALGFAVAYWILPLIF